MTQELALRPPRLPFLQAIEDRFGVDRATWKVVVEAVWPEAQSIESIAMALAYCKARGLDPLKRVVHIVPVWSSKAKCMVDTVWPGIGELRTTAFRTKGYAGQDPAQYGPDITKNWNGIEVTFPEWCQVTVYRMVQGQRCQFAGHPVYWLEEFASKKDNSPNSMWVKRPRGQITKVAEACALRLAFPEELGDEPTDAEGPVIVQEGHNGFSANEIGPTEPVSQKLLDEAKDGTNRHDRSPVQEQEEGTGQQPAGLSGGSDDQGHDVPISGVAEEGPDGRNVHEPESQPEGNEQNPGRNESIAVSEPNSGPIDDERICLCKSCKRQFPYKLRINEDIGDECPFCGNINWDVSAKPKKEVWECSNGHTFPIQDVVVTPLSRTGKCPRCPEANIKLKKAS